jgi:ubiquinone/menaquinone biosynthesis C-methylase UbiE
LDFVFIDASHHYVDVIKDFQMVYPMVKDGGWIAFHDVEPGWPGPWRVWCETARSVLSTHEYCFNLACGRKEPGQELIKPLENSPFSYSKEWINHLKGVAPDLSEAMQLSRRESEGAIVTAEKLEEAERIIASMPDHPLFKGSLCEMLKLEAAVDPLLHLWYALTLQKEGDRRMAREHLLQARRISKLASNHRIDLHLNRVRDQMEVCQQDSSKRNRQKVHSGKPMCLFLNHYYQGFLDTIYRKVPTLKSKSYDQQKHLLQAQLFSDSDFYSNGLNRAGWNADDLIVNCQPLQQQWAREHSFSGDPLEIVIEQIRRAKPVVLYLQDMAMGTRDFLAAVRPHTDLIVGQIACPISPQTDLRGFDLIFSSFPHYVENFRQLGITAYYQPLAFDSRVLDGNLQTERQYRVTFVGGISNAHGKGNAVIERVARTLPIDFWGYGAESLPTDSIIRKRHHGEVWGLDMFSILRRSQITLNRHIDAAGNYANNMRLFEATGCGALLITDYRDNLNELFEIGNEVVAYRSAEECAALIHYYTQNPNQAEKIAKAGQQRTLRDHTYLKRMEQTAEIFERHLRYRQESSRYPVPSMISHGHKVIRFDQVTSEMTTAWQSKEIPEKQRGIVQKELARMYQGDIPLIYKVLADCLYPHADPGCSILEIGCASGYYYEILEYLLNKPITYTGVDYSENLIQMAKDFYNRPEFHVADGSNLPFGDGQFSVAISSCILLHVPNYREHIRETARVTKRFVVAHRTPVCRMRPTQYLKKYAYGIETVELIFNEQEIISEFLSQGLKLVMTHQYSANEDQDNYEVTYLFKKNDDTNNTLTPKKLPKEMQNPVATRIPQKPMMLNLGCGGRYSNDWVNIDFHSNGPQVKGYNLCRGIPESDEGFDVVYHSHLLEHFPKKFAPDFLEECYRVLKPGGILRVVQPDLEQIVRLYLDLLERSVKGEANAQKRYEWILLELFDQMVRNRSGGEMLEYWKQNPMPEEDFVIKRCGSQVLGAILHLRNNPSNNGGSEDPYLKAIRDSDQSQIPKIASFRMSGEVHQWMYDRYSLKKLLQDTGFINIRQCKADESLIPDFNSYLLDIEKDGRVRKPDSFFMEAIKPN